MKKRNRLSFYGFAHIICYTCPISSNGIRVRRPPAIKRHALSIFSEYILIFVPTMKRIIDFVKKDVWNQREEHCGKGRRRWLLRQAKVLVFTVRSFAHHNTGVRSAALTFYTVMSLVPVLALIFAIVKGFGLDQSFNDYLYAAFPQYGWILDKIFLFTENLLARTRGGVMAVGGFLVLLWAVVQVFGGVEASFNNIWEVKRSRPWTRKASDYIAVIFVAPVLWVTSNTIILTLRSNVTLMANSLVADILFGAVSIVAVWTMFALIYFVVPNTKVELSTALTAGFVAGTAFEIFQAAYFYIQTNLSAYNAIYGTFAAIPLFLIWLQASWQILLFGGELSFALQNIRTYEAERQSLDMGYDNRRKVMTAVMTVFVHRLTEENGGALTSEQVSERLMLPVRIVRDVIFDLESAGLLAAVSVDDNDKQRGYLPVRDVHGMRIADVVRSVEMRNFSSVDIYRSPLVRNVAERLDAMSEAAGRDENNMLLEDIRHD